VENGLSLQCGNAYQSRLNIVYINSMIIAQNFDLLSALCDRRIWTRRYESRLPVVYSKWKELNWNGNWNWFQWSNSFL